MGKIATWNDEKGFGFITPLDGSARVFVHIKAFGRRARRPAVQDGVSYSVTKDDQGRTQAIRVRLAGEKSANKSGLHPGLSASLFALLFFAVVGVGVFLKYLPLPFLVAYFSISVVTFVAYAIDKSAAKAGRWRTNEATLHLLALLGGWPGALVAQQTLRHKSKKVPFRIVFWITVLLNCTGLAWLHTIEGQEILGRLLRGMP